MIKPISGADILQKIDSVFVPETIEHLNQMIEESFNKSASYHNVSCVNSDKLIHWIANQHPSCKYLETYGPKGRLAKALSFLEDKIIPEYKKIGWEVHFVEDKWACEMNYFTFSWNTAKENA